MRRLALDIEEGLCQGTQWVVFEPNGAALWARVRRAVESFLQELFRQGALAGNRPEQAYFVKCGPETMTQGDLDNGIVNFQVGFAPLKLPSSLNIAVTLRHVAPHQERVSGNGDTRRRCGASEAPAPCSFPVNSW